MSPYSQGRDVTMERFVGIDISKRHFDLHLYPVDQSHHFDNSPSGITRCVKLRLRTRSSVPAPEGLVEFAEIAVVRVELFGGWVSRTAVPHPVVYGA